MANPLELFRRYKDDIYRFALSYTHSREDAEDICQTVFEQLLKNPSIQPGKEKAWLMQTCANRCRNLLRSHWWSRTVPLEDVHITPGQEPDSVKEAVMALRPEYRAVVYLYYFEGYSTQEIGQLLRISQSAVSTRLHRARDLLKQELEV